MAEFIKLDEAVKLTHAFQESEIGKDQTISGVIEKDFLFEMLKQEDCEGIRIYTALNDEKKITFVLVGIDKNQNDMSKGLILDRLGLCPPYCNYEDSPLKSSK